MGLSTVLKFCLPLAAFFLASACGDEENASKLFAIDLDAKNKTFAVGQAVKVALKNKGEAVADKVRYSIDGNDLQSRGDSLVLEVVTLGDKELVAHIVSGENDYTLKKKIRVLAAKAPELYTYEIINEFPHDREAFTQGLEFYNDTLFEGTGKNGKSVLRKVDYMSGTVLAETKLDKAYFGEGITVMGDTVYQLTWQSGLGFMYNRKTLEKLGSFSYGASSEGWGLCNDGTVIFKSDGSEKIWRLNPRTLQEIDYIQIVTNSSVFNKANELEYVDGKIYANVWQKESMMIIDARSGAIEGVVNFGGLKELVTKHPQLDVFNGIAYHPGRKTFFVTGKFWDKMFEVVIKPKSP